MALSIQVLIMGSIEYIDINDLNYVAGLIVHTPKWTESPLIHFHGLAGSALRRKARTHVWSKLADFSYLSLPGPEV